MCMFHEKELIGIVSVMRCILVDVFNDIILLHGIHYLHMCVCVLSVTFFLETNIKCC